MRWKLWSLVLVVLLGAICIARTQLCAAPDAHGYIEKCEQEWVESGASGNPAAVQRCLADDFVGVNIDGGEYDKAKEISNIQSNPTPLKSNRAENVRVRFYGDAAVAQGSEVWEKQNGEGGRYVWTDTWIRRNNTWQIVAAEAVRAQAVSK
jgi:hypothetical protein